MPRPSIPSWGPYPASWAEPSGASECGASAGSVGGSRPNASGAVEPGTSSQRNHTGGPPLDFFSPKSRGDPKARSTASVWKGAAESVAYRQLYWLLFRALLGTSVLLRTHNTQLVALPDHLSPLSLMTGSATRCWVGHLSCPPRRPQANDVATDVPLQPTRASGHRCSHLSPVCRLRAPTPPP